MQKREQSGSEVGESYECGQQDHRRPPRLGQLTWNPLPIGSAGWTVFGAFLPTHSEAKYSLLQQHCAEPSGITMPAR
jgi:hypothetical protein